VSQYQKGKTYLDFTEARDHDWQWHQLGHTQVCTSLQTDRHASTPSLSFLQAGCPSCRPTKIVKALKVHTRKWIRLGGFDIRNGILCQQQVTLTEVHLKRVWVSHKQN